LSPAKSIGMEPDRSRPPLETVPGWPERERYWRRKLGRLRLGAEPLEEQLARYRRVTWALTIVPLAIGLMFIALFAAFRRPDVGALLAAVLLLPVVALAWLNHMRLERRVAAYRRERREFEARKRRGP
jgi:hypothetical protein